MFFKRLMKNVVKKAERYSSNWKVDDKLLREDLRKIGVTLILSGFVGFILPSDKIDILHAVIILVVGMGVWSNGLIKTVENDEDRKDE